MMRFMMLYRPEGEEDYNPPTAESIAEMGKFIGELAESGVLVAADGLQPSSMGARVRISRGKTTVTDGPFTETKELIAGFAIVNVDSREAAIEIGKRFLKLAGDGESEIRLMHPTAAFG